MTLRGKEIPPRPTHFLNVQVCDISVTTWSLAFLEAVEKNLW